MKKTTLALLITVFSASTLFSTVTQAEGPPGQQWHQQGGHDGRGGPEGHGGPGRGPDHGRDDRHDDRGRGPDHHYESRDRFAWQGHDFRRGQPMPPHFRGDDYRVSDWHQRGLREPPRGEHWAYIDGNYVLIAAATGVITSILLNNAFH
ncbi:RcnB family protein [Erwiniaceae bacterium BAC15a-03b]|uniref:RcnB family protein n=1 Tax=Winslowiella arboricola TaxID=2978220 RepID=A0A9J6PFC7_9GAMM|nr:RcnB family protein [Winslowiella arboricola]MCU5774058.1 RcnB family protein [Winslowiella arboricola]MCU5777009.1 RcnB family protein [Winslowiella arboricola]